MPYVVVTDDASRPGVVVLQEVADDGALLDASEVAETQLPEAVRAREASGPRWVFDAAARYPPLLAAGVRVARCHDLRLCRAILRRSAWCANSSLAAEPPGPLDRPRESPAATEATLFDVEVTPVDAVAELRAHLSAVAGSRHPQRLRLLLAAESTGALIAAEMRHDGVPWDPATHDAVLTDLLGPRPPPGRRPARLEALMIEVRALLDQPDLNLDSQPDLLAGLRRAGIGVTTTRRHELREVDHPVIAPLLEYKKLARLLSANGWAWLDAWVRDGRFHPDYAPAGVVTGRWATSGGGALQLPREIRAAVRADPGWRLVVADAAQVEPRVLAAMAGDAAMAAAGRHRDLYHGVVDAGIVATRQEAKYAMLGAIYGATSGASGALMPELARAYPRAVALVEDAARTGERGGVVTTWLGRSSPHPGERWQEAVRAAAAEDAGPADVQTARRVRRDWGRFTRNFVVQGTAAEWALCWMAGLRRRLREVPGEPHLVMFVHDEVVVHSPAEVADDVAGAVQDAAVEAGRLLFGDAPVEFPLDVSVVQAYDQAV